MYSRFKEQEYKLHFLELSQSLRSRKHLLYSLLHVSSQSSIIACCSGVGSIRNW